MRLTPGIKMSKFANSKFFLCHVVGVFSSRGRTFSLARQWFWPRQTYLENVRFVKIFTLFTLVFFAFGLPQNWGQNVENADLRAKTSEFMSKNAVKTGKSYFPILCRKWVKRDTETAFWMQKRAKRTKKRRFWRKLKIFPISLKFSALCKFTSIFEEKNLHSVALANYFAKLYVSDYQIIMM